MPMMDMSAALTNPYSLDQFTVLRRQETVNGFGESTIAITTTSGVYGVVYPSDENDLRRYPDMQIVAKALTIVTKFALRSESEESGSSFQPDLVVWGGDQFVVRHLEDYSAYASGFVKAICSSIDMVDQPPAG